MDKPVWLGTEYQIVSWIIKDMVLKYLAEGHLPDWVPRHRLPEFEDLPNLYPFESNVGSDDFIPPMEWTTVKLDDPKTDLECLITDWVITHCKNYWFSEYQGVYHFEDEEDALLFKLTWQGSPE